MGVNYKDNEVNVVGFIEEFGDFFVKGGVDFNGCMVFEWGVYGVFEIYIIEGDGMVFLCIVGLLIQCEMVVWVQLFLDSC